MYQSDNNKLDWIYKDPSKQVDREEYVLGRAIDKTLENLNEEEKQKNSNSIAKCKVEHECIPPSIRDFNKIVLSEQVDLSTKLQEDPLVAIKKREEETRRQFLQNPIQLKKLQKALKAQELKKKKKKEKKSKKSSKDLDTILMHKFHNFKSYLTDEDFANILGDQNNEVIKNITKSNNKISKNQISCNKKSDSDDSDSEENSQKNYGLVRSDGSKIQLKDNYSSSKQPTVSKKKEPQVLKKRKKLELSESEKKKIREEMEKNSKWREEERKRNLQEYRKDQANESGRVEEFDKLFVHKQLVKIGKDKLRH